MFTQRFNDDTALAELKKMTARLVPIPMNVITEHLTEGDQQALKKLIQAAHIMNGLYMEQLWKDNRVTFENLQNDSSALGRARAHYYWINKSPWSELDEDKAFIPGAPGKPHAANFYPESSTKEEIENWMATLTEQEKEQAESYFTVIKKKSHTQKLAIIPFSEFYKNDLEKAAILLREAAAMTSNETLKHFLNLRAAAFLSNDYYESDLAWLKLDAPLDITIGPYETYDDKYFGYKATFEAFITLRDDEETNKIAIFSRYLQEIEDHLPIDPKYRNPKIGSSSPIRVVNELYAAGQGSVQTAAFNLPNDERVLKQTGGKRVLLKNVQEAKFKHILIPIAQAMLSKSELPELNFDAFFTHILAHELSHGLGPKIIVVNGQETSVRVALKDLYGAIEEAKADVLGLFMLQYLLDQQSSGKINKIINISERELYVTYFASMFRTLRFGIHEAHGKGMALQFNYLQEKGAIVLDAEGRFSLAWDKIKSAFLDLNHHLLTIEATGNYLDAKIFLEKKAIMTPELAAALAKMADIPTDIEPVFVTAKKLVPEVIASGGDFENVSNMIDDKIATSSLLVGTHSLFSLPDNVEKPMQYPEGKSTLVPHS